MKPIIVDIKDMSDSTEVYGERPNPFFAVFIYIILFLVVIAVIWMGFFKIDIVVNGSGTAAVSDDLSTVTNIYGGNVLECGVKDGQSVKEGDLLYVVETKQLQLELNGYEEQLSNINKKIEIMNAYLKWLHNSDENFDAYASNKFYDEYAARRDLVNISISDIQNNYSAQNNSYDQKIESQNSMIAYYEDQMQRLHQAISDIKSRQNSFDLNQAYYYAEVNDYLTSYNNTDREYNDEINKYSTARDSAQQKKDKEIKIIEKAEKKITELQKQIEELEQEKDKDNSDKIKKKQELIVGQEAVIAEAEKNKAAQETVIEECDLEIVSAQTKKQSVLSSLETQTVLTLEAKIAACQETLKSNEIEKKAYESEKESITDTGTKNDEDNIISSERQAVTVELNSIKDQKKEYKLKISSIKDNISAASVYAKTSGKINLLQTLVEGDYLASGVEVMSIIPEMQSEKYIVRTYISNKDIAKINKGMKVKYEMSAYPSSEYGILQGIVSFVSADLKLSDNNGSAYYVIESTIDNSDLYNSDGEKLQIKVGMLCDTKIVIEQKSVLKYLLEKIKLIDS